jgi:hypothetical protein
MSLPPTPPGWRLIITPARKEVIEHPEQYELRRDDGRRWPLICSRGQLRHTVEAVTAGNPWSPQLQLGTEPDQPLSFGTPVEVERKCPREGRRS